MKLLQILIFCFSLVAFNASAQEIATEELPSATISPEFRLTLDRSIPVQAYYKADITHFEFSNAEEGQKILNGYLRTNLSEAELHFDEGFAIIHIRTEYMDPEAEHTHESLQQYLDNYVYNLTNH